MSGAPTTARPTGLPPGDSARHWIRSGLGPPRPRRRRNCAGSVRLAGLGVDHGGLQPRMSMFAYYDTDADIAWFPTGESDDVVSERVPGGLREYDRTTRELVAIEVWDASTRLPRTPLEALPAPSTPRTAAA